MNVRSSNERVRIVRGRERVLSVCGELSGLCESCDQPGILDDLDYHFNLPGFRRKRPTLLLIEALDADAVCPLAAVLVYEYQVCGLGTGVFAADFLGGARSVVAPVHLRARAAFAAADALMQGGGLIVQLTYEGEESPERLSLLAGAERRWAARERQISSYLQVEPNLEDTLAQLGKRTRRNFRHYRRLADTELGARLVPSPKLTREEFLAFNERIDFAVPAKQAAARFEALHRVRAPLFFGLQNTQGEWIALLGGHRRGPDLLVEWQMNRSDLERYSLSTTMRAYLMEYAVEQACRRIYMVRGTTSSIRNSLVPERLVDIVVARPGVPKWLIDKIAKVGEDLPHYEGRLPELLPNPERRGAPGVEAA